MNKTAIKNFAIWARVNLIEAVKQKAYEYEIKDGVESVAALDAVGGRLLSKTEKEQRSKLISQIKSKGYNQVMEEVAYTWFNRFIALRYMEVNGFLPSKVRVFSDEAGAFKPDILSEAMTVELDGLDREKVFQLLDKQDNEGLYKYLLITQCNALGECLPGMFERIENYTELLFPNNLLKADSVIGRMISDIPEEDWTDAVQIIGWMYQYYNTELKDETFAALKKNIKISKDKIPAATQLFTPDWIVRYMVENSLGRLWVEGHPNDELKANWKYYLEEAEQEPSVQAQLAEIRKGYAVMNPEDIKVIDPCMGSGHILVYAFDVLMQIYLFCGWSERDAAKSILENNLYGLDIDDRAAQLAYFAVMMKARQYDRRIFTRNVQPSVCAIVESNAIDSNTIDYFANNDPKLKKELEKLISELRDAKEYGSILNISKIDFAALRARLDEIRDDISLFREIALAYIEPLIRVAENMARQYDVVITNPPYMAVANASGKVQEFIKKNYPNSKSDFFAVFIEKCAKQVKPNGYQAMITQHSWMFLSDYSKFRNGFVHSDIINMAHLGARAFEEIGGEVVQTTTFVVRKSALETYLGKYIRLVNATSEQEKEKDFFIGENAYIASMAKIKKIPDLIYAYWLSDAVMNLLESAPKLEQIGQAKQGLATTDNKRFLRLWQELDFARIDFSCGSTEDISDRGSKWFPYNKAGTFRRWSAINEYVVNYENDGLEIKASVLKKYPYLKTPGFVVKNTEYYFKNGITWNDVSTSKFCCRLIPTGYIFDAAGPMFFSKQDVVLMAYFNSVVFQLFTDIICQGLHYSTGHIPRIPYLAIDDVELKAQISTIAEENHTLSVDDWDAFETSWDFKKHPLI